MSEKVAKLFILGASIFFFLNAIFFLSAAGTLIPQMIWLIAFYQPISITYFVLSIGYVIFIGAGFVILSVLIAFPIVLGYLLGVRCYQWRSDPASHRVSLVFVGIIGLLTLSPVASLLAVLAAATSGAPLEFNDFNLARIELTEGRLKTGFLTLVG